MRTPPTSTDPPVGVSRPPIRFSSVVLPEPDGPISARKSPGGNVEIDALQHVDALAAAREVLVDVRDPNQRVPLMVLTLHVGTEAVLLHRDRSHRP